MLLRISVFSSLLPPMLSPPFRYLNLSIIHTSIFSTGTQGSLYACFPSGRAGLSILYLKTRCSLVSISIPHMQQIVWMMQCHSQSHLRSAKLKTRSAKFKATVTRAVGTRLLHRIAGQNIVFDFPAGHFCAQEVKSQTTLQVMPGREV